MVRRLLLLAFGFFLQSCASGMPQTVTSHHFGYVRVVAANPQSDGTKVALTRVQALGFWMEPGAGGAGLRGLTHLYLPQDCRLVVLVQTEAMLLQAEAMFRELQTQGERICLVNDTP